MVNFKYLPLALGLPAILQAEIVQGAIQFFDSADDFNTKIPEELAAVSNSIHPVGRVNLTALNMSPLIQIPEQFQKVDPNLIVNELLLGVDCSKFKCLKYENSLIPTMPDSSQMVLGFYQKNVLPPDAKSPFAGVDDANVIPDPLKHPSFLKKRSKLRNRKFSSKAKQGSSDEIFSRKRRMINPRAVEEYPASTVSLEIRKKGQFSMSTCTGSILHERVILTAAHCIVSREQKVFYPPNYNQIYGLESITINVGVTESDFGNYCLWVGYKFQPWHVLCAILFF